MKNTALILIDIQNDYFPGGALVLDGAPQAAKKAAELLSQCRQMQQLIVHIQHETLDENIPLMQPNTVGQEIHNSVTPLKTEYSLTKHYPNAFWKTELESILRQHDIQKVLIAGMMTHMCVSSTTRAAMERGFDITVINDACATCSLQLDAIDIPAHTVHRTALAELTLLAKIETLESFIG